MNKRILEIRMIVKTMKDVLERFIKVFLKLRETWIFLTFLFERKEIEIRYKMRLVFEEKLQIYRT